jgi:hypothetical protein
MALSVAECERKLGGGQHEQPPMLHAFGKAWRRICRDAATANGWTMRIVTEPIAVVVAAAHMHRLLTVRCKPLRQQLASCH